MYFILQQVASIYISGLTVLCTTESALCWLFS